MSNNNVTFTEQENKELKIITTLAFIWLGAEILFLALGG